MMPPRSEEGQTEASEDQQKTEDFQNDKDVGSSRMQCQQERSIVDTAIARLRELNPDWIIIRFWLPGDRLKQRTWS